MAARFQLRRSGRTAPAWADNNAYLLVAGLPMAATEAAQLTVGWLLAAGSGWPSLAFTGGLCAIWLLSAALFRRAAG
ncbi:hypothetical protein [Arenimonas donghaensis]|uniref:Uncharacterized protein n=1 Tax=Arenimonas donghaensis DSM 18148 = HO3-R19 TaxID=1121014 RepID=A0A087MFP6_9GAMM|nr:hypothetical protein [Arenimonas donghaensis]KFL35699.1 hypothetical protein N788_08150 [Arenimonas donghaensis DSM 18148 = HO3-R19]